jgi:glycosyltransferase involved in cell wall biosynthesis
MGGPIVQSGVRRIFARLFGDRGSPASGMGDFVAFVGVLSERSQVHPQDELYAGLASTRLRVIIPARELARRFPVWLVPIAEFIERPRLEHLGRPQAVVIGKLSSAYVSAKQRQLRQLIAALRAGERQGRLLADLSDDYAALAKALNEPFLKEYQRGLGRACEFIVPTEALASSVRGDARRGLHLIEDPFESPAAKPARAWSAGPVRLAWFGSIGPFNLALIEQGLKELAAAFPDQPMHVELVAQRGAQQAILAAAARLASASPRFAVSFTTWSLAATEAAIERADFVWLPQEHRAAWGRVKSHNRLVSAIRGGRLAIASPIPSYQELAAYAWVGEPLSEGLRWALANPQAAAQRVSEGQRYVEQRFSPETIGRRWAEVLGLQP